VSPPSAYRPSPSASPSFSLASEGADARGRRAASCPTSLTRLRVRPLTSSGSFSFERRPHPRLLQIRCQAPRGERATLLHASSESDVKLLGPKPRARRRPPPSLPAFPSLSPFSGPWAGPARWSRCAFWPARHENQPERPCLGRCSGTKHDLSMARQPAVLYLARPGRAVLGPGSCRVGPGGPNGHL
jgi:hypothetical protein